MRSFLISVREDILETQLLSSSAHDPGLLVGKSTHKSGMFVPALKFSFYLCNIVQA